ncbi:hypothetical protein BKA62DRAFT_700182 [Auriculariales sp. MPI-PUGE-AT-0066]|nr:hypothetical protein BKA62DRAFT_700182 [Auriculariales sp. MPI-PUGE-AT-0066]
MATYTREQEVIRDIRRKNGVDDEFCEQARRDPVLWQTVQNLKSNLQQSLKVLSADLYSRPAHAVLEIIQNADDNAYDMVKVEPTLIFTLRTDHMLVECNELGFTEENVRAFCGVGLSTKRNSSGYIGAKSIFQQSSKVSIHSKNFCFALDRNTELGMISPQWVAPFSQRQDWTCMRLDFCDNFQAESVKGQLDNVRETVLLFMRRLVHLHIDYGSSTCHVTRRISTTGEDISIAHTSSLQPSNTWHFLRITNCIAAYTAEPKRPDATGTTVEICFPLTEAGMPWIAWQMVHAYLPLRGVGFKFIIQADFLTAANREDILGHLKWNQNIVAAIPHTFMTALTHFQCRPGLEFEWLRYLPEPTDRIDPFFQPAMHTLWNMLRSARIIKCLDGTYSVPSQVRIPHIFTINGIPLLPTTSTPFKYVSTGYPEDVVPHLKHVGVIDMSFSDLMDGLMGIKSFQEFSSEWMERVCELVMTHGTSHVPGIGWNLTVPRIRLLRLIPMKGGAWMNSSDTTLLFFHLEDTHVPPALGLSIVDLGASKPYQRQLLERLGVQPLTIQFIHQRILEVHASTSSRTRPGLLALCEQLHWLFEHRFEVPALPIGAIMLPDEQGVFSPANSLYLDRYPIIPVIDPHRDRSHVAHPVPSELSTRLKDNLQHPAKFLHPTITLPTRIVEDLSGGSYDELRSPVDLVRQTFMAPHIGHEAGTPAQRLATWYDWLQSSLGVAIAPRVIDGRPARELVDMVLRTRLKEPKRLLLFLRTHWNGIQNQLKSSAELHTFCNWLGSVEIKCQNGGITEMRSTFLPTAFVHLDQMNDDTPLLPIDEPDAGWTFLKDFGISVEPDARFFLKRLLALMTSTEVTAATVRALYKQLEARFDEIANEIREAFQKYPLFFVGGQWRHWHQVVWDGPQILTMKWRMCTQYSTLDEFFQSHLALRDAEPAILVEELNQFALDHHGTNLTVEQEERLFQLLAYGASTVDLINEWSFNPDIIQLTYIRAAWYLPDPSGFLFDMFRSLLDFIAFSPAQLIVILPLIHHLHLEARRVDRCVAETTIVDGVSLQDSKSSLHAKRNLSETNFFRSRLSCFQRMQHYRQSSIPIIGSVTCYNVGTITNTHSCGKQRVSQPCDCCVTLKDGELLIMASVSLKGHHRRGVLVADAIRRALGLPEEDIPLVAIALRYEELDELELVFRRSGVHGLDAALLHVRVDAQSGSLPYPLGVSRVGRGASTSASSHKATLSHANQATGWLHDRKSIVPSLAAFNSSLNPIELEADVKDLAVDMSNHASWATNVHHIDSNAPRDSPLVPTSIPGADAFATRNHGSSVGYVGEKLVYDFLHSQLHDFTYQNWTSELRVKAGFPGISAAESLADFSYRDEHGLLTKLLGQGDYTAMAPIRRRFHYLIEVKSTTGEQGDIFHMSRLQFLQSWRLTGGRNSHNGAQLVYVLFRVSGIGKGSRPVLKAYLDPHQLLVRGNLRIESEVVDVRIVIAPKLNALIETAIV